MRRGPHLVVAPASLLENWERELALWCPRLRVVTYHGAHKEMVRNQLEKWRYDVSVLVSCLFECSSHFSTDCAVAGRGCFSRSGLSRPGQGSADGISRRDYLERLLLLFPVCRLLLSWTRVPSRSHLLAGSGLVTQLRAPAATRAGPQVCSSSSAWQQCSAALAV